MSAFGGGFRKILSDVETLAIVLTARLLEWLRDLPGRRALHQLKLLAELLRKHGEHQWSGRLLEMGKKTQLAHDAGHADRLVDAMQEILGCFGGTGSLSDVYLSPQNGHKIKDKEVEAVNARLGALRTQLFLSARQTIAREQWKRRREAA
jgi:hypothetical protein